MADADRNSSLHRRVQVDGVKLRKIRESLRMTQPQAAAKSGYSTRLIRKLEQGGPINRETLDHVVTAYQEELVTSTVGGIPSVIKSIEFIICTPKDALERFAFLWFDRVFNQRDISAIDELTHPDVALVAEGETHTGRDAIRNRILAIHAGFSPIQVTIERLYSDGNTVIVYWQVDAVHSGPFLGIAATDRKISIRGSTMGVIINDQFIEARDHWDVKHLIDQIS